MNKIRFVAVCALTALSSLAQAQPGPPQCKPTETQPECHARLKCKASEDLEDCKARLAKQPAGQQGDQGGGDDRGRGNDDRGRGNDDRGRGDNRGNDRWNNGNDGGNDRGRGNDRWNDRGRDDGGGGGGGGRRSRGGGGGSSFAANKTFGLGLELGEPTGLNGKYFFGPSTALDFGVGAIYSHYYYGDGIHLYGDVLFHPTSLVSADAFELPFFVGGGLRYWSFEYCDGRFCDYRGSAIGLRIPLGVSFDFNDIPLDIAIQLVPVLDFVTGEYYDRGYGDRTHFGIDFSVVIRYWFK